MFIRLGEEEKFAPEAIRASKCDPQAPIITIMESVVKCFLIIRRASIKCEVFL
jgi:hypothetical protein